MPWTTWRRPPNDSGVIWRLCALGTSGAPRQCPYAATTSVVPNPQHLLRLLVRIYANHGKGPTVKFRCERDVLADALATAGRAATSRTGALPVLEGVHLQVRGDELSVTGTDLEMSIRLTVTVGGVSDGAVVVPARLSADAVVASRRGGGVQRRQRRREHQRRTLAVLVAQLQPRRLSRAGRSGGRGGHLSRRRTSPTPCARWCGRRAPTRHAPSDHRRARRRRGRRRAHGRDRLVPPRGA